MKKKWMKNWFSNMLPMDKPLVYQGVSYRTVENFYQAMKIPKNRIDLRKEIAALNPYQAKTKIRNKKQYLWREDWSHDLAIKVMRFALEFKFAPGTSWHTKLLDTKNEEIVEWNNWGDIFWGKNIDTKQGQNWLGKILMEIRDKYNK